LQNRDARTGGALLDDLDVFVRVAQSGSFTKAARALGVPKSTVSRAVARLEDRTRVQLLERTTRAVRLTDAGRALAEQAAPHAEGLREALQVVGEEASQPRGTVRITGAPDLAGILGELVARFTARHPTIGVEVDLSTRFVDLVTEGFDCAFRATMRKLDDASLVVRRLGESRLQLYASPSFVARRGAPRSPAEVASFEGVLFRAKREQRLALSGPRGAKAEATLVGRIVADEFPFLAAALRAGAGIGALPSFLAAADVEVGRLVPVLGEWSGNGGRILLVHPRVRHVPRRVALFRDFAREELRERFAR
jgi:DNA-binding transcriptional LysR family regulator